MTKLAGSHIELGLHLDGKDNVYLRVPTAWDAVNKTRIGHVKTPISKRLIAASGKDSSDLQNNFIIEMAEILQNPLYAEEALSMFKPKEYWAEWGE